VWRDNDIDIAGCTGHSANDPPFTDIGGGIDFLRTGLRAIGE
jgi:hypothetical protein